jgi:diguanylate cyclase (GGDEF)-like protein
MLLFTNRNKLILGASTIFLIGTLMFTYITYFQISSLIHEEEEVYIHTTLEKWEHWTEYSFAIITSLADTISSSSKEAYRDPKFQFFLSQTRKSGDLLDLAYGLEDGYYYYATSAWSPPDNYDPRKRPWYQASKSLLAPTITWPYRGVENNSPLYISLTAPILKDDQFLGVVTGDVTMDFLMENLFSELHYRGGSAFFINQSGDILVHNEKQWINKHISELDPVFSINQEFNNVNDRPLHFATSKDFDYRVMSLKNANFFLVMATNKAYEQQLLVDELYSLLLYVPIVMLLIIVCFYFYEKKLFLPIIHSLEHDNTTQLPNRNNIEKKIYHRFLAENKAGTLIIISMDNFNQLTAAYPKSVVISLQKQVKMRIQNLLTTNALLGYFSDNTFIAYEPNGTKDTAIKRLEYLQLLSDEVAKVYHIDNKELHCNLSIGASCSPLDSLEIEQLIDNAFTAMASAREDDTLSYSLFVPEHNQKLGKAILLSNAMKDTIKKNEFELVYQPQIDSRNNQVVGVEALIRWPSSELGRMVSPVDFIPVAEASDLIVEIGDYVIDAAVNQISQWNKQELKFGKVSINISPRQILKHDFIEKLLGTLRLYNVDAKQIELEITETTVIGNPQKSIEVMQELKNHGFSLAMDDFGTGYSSLEYLKIMPLDKLKIDRTFIRDLHTDERDGVIVKMVVAMAKALDYIVLAEGVENKEQLKYLQANGCHLIQGYYFAKPMNASLLEHFLVEELPVSNT